MPDTDSAAKGTYVALVRGVGPGDPRMRNEKLRGVLEALGFSGVRSVIASGNIVFESEPTATSDLEAAIEAAWPQMLGFEALTIVKSRERLSELIAADPFAGATHSGSSYLMVTFFKHATEAGLALPHKPAGKPYEIVGHTGDALFSVTDNTVVKTSDLMTWLERRYGKEMTSRTLVTLQRILKKMDG